MNGYLLLILSSLLQQATFIVGGKIEEECKTCKDLVENFKKGMEQTAKQKHFGGGDTAWEEKKLGSYARSETRLLEILEIVCKDASKESKCHAMVEEHEELIEDFWMNKHTELSDLEKFLCVEELKVCCADGKYGKDCADCPSGAENPCNGRGKCEGSGTRGGNGECNCDVEYSGDKCEECADGYYKDNDECKKCDKACDSCNDSTNKGCESCADGYEENEENVCTDVNECLKEDVCEVGEFCMNTQGSHKCHKCDPSCGSEGCTNSGRFSCNNCAQGYAIIEEEDKRKGCKDLNECEEEGICTVGTYCINKKGTHVCEKCNAACKDGCTGDSPSTCVECNAGYEKTDEGCADIDQCIQGVVKCTAGQACVNQQGEDSCQDCHASCNECSSPQADGCLNCRAGFALTDGKCQDINECNDSPCDVTTETCVNKPGSYKCLCRSGYARSKSTGKCVKKKKGNDGGNILAEDKLSEQTTLSEGEQVNRDIFDGKFLTPSQLKIGSLIYAAFFIALFLMFKCGYYYAMSALILVYACVVVWLSKGYPVPNTYQPPEY